MSAKREQFLKMIGQGWAVAAAARELGVSRSSISTATRMLIPGGLVERVRHGAHSRRAVPGIP